MTSNNIGAEKLVIIRSKKQKKKRKKDFIFEKSVKLSLLGLRFSSKIIKIGIRRMLISWTREWIEKTTPKIKAETKSLSKETFPRFAQKMIKAIKYPTALRIKVIWKGKLGKNGADKKKEWREYIPAGKLPNWGLSVRFKNEK